MKHKVMISDTKTVSVSVLKTCNHSIQEPYNEPPEGYFDNGHPYGRYGSRCISCGQTFLNGRYGNPHGPKKEQQ